MILSTLLSFVLWVPDWIDSWLNYPGLEAWKFVNLIVFVGAALYFLRRRLREALRARSETIKRELQQARVERDQALAKLAEVEARFANLDAEVAAVKEKASAEAEGERGRIRAATDEEIAKVREQAKREIESAGKAARAELRRFGASESVRLAEEILAREISPEYDIQLTSQMVQELGGTHA